MKIFHLQGHRLAKRLADEGIETSVITDSEVFALMSRVNKVIIGTHVVFADGGLKAPCGTFTIAQCAKFFSVPVSTKRTISGFCNFVFKVVCITFIDLVFA